MDMHEDTGINTVCRHGDKQTDAGGCKYPEMAIGEHVVSVSAALYKRQIIRVNFVVDMVEHENVNHQFLTSVRTWLLLLD